MCSVSTIGECFVLSACVAIVEWDLACLAKQETAQVTAYLDSCEDITIHQLVASGVGAIQLVGDARLIHFHLEFGTLIH
jgi:hypothetical protein